jgi:S-adenosylmethionine:tRNA ribosyltransferase-isomerase
MDETGNLDKTIKEIKTSEFDYQLPDGQIAKYPLAERDHSKLLIWENGVIGQAIFKNIPRFLPHGAMLVFNNTRVVRARLLFTKSSGAKIEVFCLEPHLPSDYQFSFSQAKSVVWRCLVGNAKKWKNGKLSLSFDFNGVKATLAAEISGKGKEDYFVRFEWDEGLTFSEVIEHAGVIPIPPYLHRESEETDKVRYQTVYAKNDGSVAAPTAGLHFTDALLEDLQNKGYKRGELTLHVGAGTFQPVKSGLVSEHTMHDETVVVSLCFLKELLNHHGKVIAVGTTSVRSIESLYWLGVRIFKHRRLDEVPHVLQWEPYQPEPGLTSKEALNLLVSYFEENKLQVLHFNTQIIIVPGYKFRFIDGMLTNFHQPQSTLLLLIAAFLGDDWKKVYEYALKNGFRFLSYGDSNLYLK